MNKLPSHRISKYLWTWGTMESRSIAVAAWGPNRLDVFGLGEDSAMYHKSWNGQAGRPHQAGPSDRPPLAHRWPAARVHGVFLPRPRLAKRVSRLLPRQRGFGQPGSKEGSSRLYPEAAGVKSAPARRPPHQPRATGGIMNRSGLLPYVLTGLAVGVLALGSAPASSHE